MNVTPTPAINPGLASGMTFGQAFKVHHATLLGLLGAWIFDALDATIYAYAVPSIIKDLNATFAEAFSVVSVFFICTAVGGLIIGNIGDKIGRKPTVMLSVALYGIFNFFCGTANSIFELYIYRGLVGFALGGLWPAAMSLLSEIWPAKSRGTAIAVLQSGWCIGLFASAAFAFFLIPAYGWRGMFYATVVPAILVFFGVWFFVKESPVWQQNKKFKQDTAKSSNDSLPIIKLFNKRNFKSAMLGLGVSAFGQFGWWTLFTFLPTYLDKTLGLGITKGAEFMIYTSIGALFGYNVFGYYSDIYGRRIMFAVFSIAMAVMIPVFIFTVMGGGVAYLPIVAIALGFSTGYYSGYGALYSELFPTDIRATASAFCINLGRASLFVGPVLIPYLIPRVGFDMAMGVASLSFLVAAGLVMLLRETKGIEITANDLE